MAKNQLTNEDQAVINEFVQKFEAGIEAIEKAKQTQVGDYLVLYLGDHNGNMVIQKNSYGAPVKYKVVHSSKHGIPFIKRVSKKGTPVGKLFSCIGGLETDNFRSPGQKFEFTLDPDFADSILLADEYDPANLHRSKKDIWKAVTDHNKANKIKTHEMKDVVAFFRTINVGDTLWTSNISFFLVQDKKTMSPKDFNTKAKWKDQTRYRGPFVTVITVRDKSGKVRDICPDFFHQKALYRERPRSYKELNI
ncbi:unnamed protein product [Sphagnum balticum]